MSIHSELTVNDGIHHIHAREHADFPAMLGASTVTADIGRVARKNDDGSFHLLTGVFPSKFTAITPVAGMHIYLSAATGNDNNTGVSAASTVATVARAFGLIPPVISAPVVIHVGAGSYVWSKLPKPVQLNSDARIWIVGDGAGVGDGFTVVASDTCGAGTNYQAVTTTLLSPALDAYQSYTLDITSGPAAGWRRTIMSNQAGASAEIWPARQFEQQDGYTPVTPNVGDSFRIVRPAAVFTSTETEGTLFGGIGSGDAYAPLMLVNLAFDTNGGMVSIDNCTVYGAGIEWRGTQPPALNSVSGSFGAWDHVVDSYYTVPYSASMSTAKAAWFADIGLGTGLSNLAKWRGWGWGVPDIRSFVATLGQINQCTISMLGVFGGFQAVSCAISIGGYFRSYSSFYSCMVEITGRGYGASPSSVVSWQLGVSSSICFMQSGLCDFTGQSVTQLFVLSSHVSNGNAGSRFVSTGNNRAIHLFGVSDVIMGGQITIENRRSGDSAAIEFASGTLSVLSGTVLNLTMSGAGVNAIIVEGSGHLKLSTVTANITGVVKARSGGVIDELSGGAFNVSAPTTPILVTDGGRLNQRGGTLSSVCSSSGHGLVCDDGAVSLRGGANTTLTGLDTGKVGAFTNGDGKIRYLEQPTGVSGPGGDLKCGSSAAVADSSLSVDGTSIVDAYGANRQSMAAVAA